MLVSNEEEKILLTEVSKSLSLDLNSDSVDGLLPVSAVYTDVGVVPEHQKNELQRLISNLESIYE